MNMKQELRRAGEAVTPVLRDGAAAAWKLCGAARKKMEQGVRSCIDRRSQPEMVYISVPGRLREDDVRLMMAAARGVYLSGRIPVCPYLMFPVDGIPMETARKEADLRMRFRLMDRCQTFLICGTRWTDEMWAEANHAITRGMEIKTDQGVGGRPAARPVARLCLPAPRMTREAS
ncbi:MAG: hypothetical protein IJT94_15815 [Oscillibacter sp.]|nr:hypothetical protein [Oscillibacter sp.]